MKKILYFMDTSNKFTIIEFILNEIVLIIALCYSYLNSKNDTTYVLITIIIILICIIAFAYFSIWGKKEKQKIIKIIWSGTAKFLLYNSLIMISYVVLQSDLICILIYLFAIFRLIICIRTNIKANKN